MPSKYKLSPSSSERFLTCTASLPYNILFIGNEATLKGNLQHHVAFLRLDYLLNGKDHTKEIDLLTDYKHEYIDPKNPSLKVKWDVDCDKTVNNYISYIKQLIKEYKPLSVVLEYRVKMAFYDNNINGVIDCAMILEGGDLIIIDLKTGRVKVDTDDNNQMLMYAYGMIQNAYKNTNKVPKSIIISICQSMVNNTQAMKYSVEQMVKWYVDQQTPMYEINTNKLQFNPNKTACRYCQHRADCNARIKAGVV